MRVNVKKIAKLTGHTDPIYALDKGTEEHRIYSAGADKVIAQWNLETLRHDKSIATFPSALYSICHIPEKQLLLGGTSNGQVYILDLAGKERIRILENHSSQVFNIRYSLETNRVFTVGGDGMLMVYSLDDFALIKMEKLCDEIVRDIDFNYVSSEIAVGSGDGSIRVFDLETLKEKKVFIGHERSSNVVRFSPDGRFLLTGGRDAHLNIWQVGNYELVKSIPAHEWAIYDIVFSPDSNLFATASRDKTVKVWDNNTYELLKVLDNENYNGHQFSVNKLIWHTYKNYLISAGDDRSIILWEIIQN